MRASTPTKLSLARFAEVMGIDPWHFASVALDGSPSTEPHRQKSYCDAAIFQHAWQSAKRTSREDVARAIRAAEDALERFIGYRLVPDWEVEERALIARAGHRRSFGTNLADVRGMPLQVQLKWKHVISGGVRAVTLIDDVAPIVWTDADNDGFEEQAVVTVTTTAAPCEVRCFYPGKAGDRRWEIRPATVSKVGNTATIKFPRYLAVIEEIQEKLGDPANAWRPVLASGSTDADFLASVDVYRVWNDPQSQATGYWNPEGSRCSCGDVVGGCHCGWGIQYGCVTPTSEREGGWVSYHPGSWIAEDEEWESAALASWRVPDFLQVNYYAGLEDNGLDCPRTQMAPELERIVARMAMAKLDHAVCTCAKGEWEQLQADLRFSSGATELARYRLNAAELGNPFGTRRGEIEAWDYVNHMGLGADNVSVLA